MLGVRYNSVSLNLDQPVWVNQLRYLDHSADRADFPENLSVHFAHNFPVIHSREQHTGADNVSETCVELEFPLLRGRLTI